MSLDVGSSGEFGADALGDTFYPLYRWVFSEDSTFVADVDRKLSEARMADTVELYLSRALAIGTLSGGALWVVGTLLGYLLFATGLVPIDTLIGIPAPNEALLELMIAIRIPLLILVTGLVFGSLGFAAGFGALLVVPYSRASAREREINMLMADSVAFMYALSVGGMNQLEILEAMARADDTYGEVSYEFKSIVQETEYFDTDYRTAIRNQAMETPSDELSQFLTDMLSIVNSGGDLSRFLEDKKDKHMRTAKQEQELTLETLELFGEMYMTLSLFPLLLIIILVIMSMLGDADELMLYGTVYALIPLVGAGFLVLVSTVKRDEPGDGYLVPDGGSAHLADPNRNPLFDLGLIERFTGEYGVFDRIKRRERGYEFGEILRRPHHFLRDFPLYTLALTVPLSLVLVGVAAATGSAPTTWQGFINQPVWSTFVWVYVPLYLIGIPLAVFYEWNQHSRHAITKGLSDDLRKLSSANDTGMTLLESVQVVSETSSGKLAREFETMHAKVNYGTSLKDALIEFNNRYHIPRLARTVKLISKAQEASSQITAVLTTAAQASENQDDIDRERKSRTRMQVVIIVMTYLTLLAVMAILKTQFLDVMSGMTDQAANGDATADVGGGGPDFGGGIDTGLLSVMFFHAVTMQAILSGMISGYMRDAKIVSGVKYVIVLVTIALAVWMVVG
ncbi:type II secretion system F family protein [Natronorarus salvus]|uniref:type II secretion system F family protein n=1 Tax=Natronorarus salvus TaxID=3117733 RepID=UPI002F26D7C4